MYRLVSETRILPPSDDQTLGYLKFQGENTVSDFKDYAYIVGKTVEVDNGIEDGSITLYTLDSGTRRTSILRWWWYRYNDPIFD